MDNLNSEFVKLYDGTFKKGKKHGKGKEIYFNNESYEGYFDNSLRHGNGVFYSANGSEKIKGFWDHGKAVNTKSITEYWDNGNIKYKGGFNGNQWNGKGVICYLNGNICFEGELNNGKIIKGAIKNNDGIKILEGSFSNKLPGNFTLYHKNGNRCIDCIFFPKNKYYEIKEYNLSGKLKFKGKIQKDLLHHGSEDKQFLTYFLGMEITKLVQKLDELDIKYKKGTFYYPKSNINSPKIQSIVEYNDNHQLDNDYKTFYENGLLHIHKMFSNGKENGFYKTFYKSGRPHIDCFKENNQFIGLYKEYNDNNDSSLNIKKIGTYIINNNNEEILQNATTYNNNKKIYEGNFDKNNKYTDIGKLYYDNESNSIKYDGNFVNNKYSGEGKLYYPNGNNCYQGDWFLDKKHGTGTSYYESTGHMEYIGDWVNNEKHGTGSLSNESGEQVWTGNFHYNEIQIVEPSEPNEDDLN